MYHFTTRLDVKPTEMIQPTMEMIDAIYTHSLIITSLPIPTTLIWTLLTLLSAILMVKSSQLLQLHILA